MVRYKQKYYSIRLAPKTISKSKYLVVEKLSFVWTEPLTQETKKCLNWYKTLFFSFKQQLTVIIFSIIYKYLSQVLYLNFLEITRSRDIVFKFRHFDFFVFAIFWQKIIFFFIDAVAVGDDPNLCVPVQSRPHRVCHRSFKNDFRRCQLT